MTLTCPETPARVDQDRLEVLLKCEADNGDYVECRVTAIALIDCCGAKKALNNEEQLRAFEQHREKIVAAWQRKYSARKVERLSDRIVVRLDVADL